MTKRKPATEICLFCGQVIPDMNNEGTSEQRDLVAVVRCKDCKYWDAVKNPKHKGVGICKPPSVAHGGYCVYRGATKSYDYCSRGKLGSRDDMEAYFNDR